MGTTFYLGRKINSGGGVGLGVLGSGQQRFYTPNALTDTIIAARMGFLGGRYYTDSGSATTRLGLAATTSNGTPAALLASTGTIAVANAMSFGGEGVYYEADLESLVLLTPGTYSLGLTSGTPRIAHGMIAAASITATNENFYQKASGGSYYPTNPVGGSPTNEGHMDIVVIGVTNTAPHKPSALSPSGNQVNGDLTPQMQATYSDDEMTVMGREWDYAATARIQVQNEGGSVTLWDYTYSTTPGERAADRTDITYAGTAITAGPTYRWRIAHFDRAGAFTWSDWTTFMVNPGGSVETPTTPTGKQNSQTPGVITAKWSHAGALAMTHARVRLYRNGILENTSAWIAKSAANNATFTVAWADTAFGALVPGESYAIDVQGRDSGSVESPYSGTRSFTINARPTTPTSLSPGNGDTVSALPKLSGVTTDPDNTAGQLTMTVEITRANSTVVTRTATLVSGNTYEYQTTSVDLPSTQTFSYRMRSSDGVFQSEWSSPTTVIYGTGPTVTITSPSPNAVLTTSTPVIAWSAAGQVSRRVEIWSGNDLTHDSGNLTTAVQTYTMPAGILRNGKTYAIKVYVTNSVPLQGVSQITTFSVAFTPPSPLAGFVAYPLSVGSDTIPSAIQMDWELTTYPQSKFGGYDIFRRALSGAFEPGEDQLTWLRHIPSALQTSFVDYHARSGVAWEYIGVQSIIQDLDVISSADAVATAQLTLQDIVLASALDPTVYRASLKYLASAGEGMTHDLKQDQRQAIPIGARVGRTIRGAYQAWEATGRFQIVTDAQATADQRMKELRDAVMNGRTFSLRDHKNRKRWVTITGYREQERGHTYEVELSFREEDFTEGEDPTAFLG